jgi:hypothetical protein
MSGFDERFIQQGFKHGFQLGYQLGYQQGIRQGEARVLASLLQLRFGELPQAAAERIASADADTLLRWSERVLSAKTLDEVFGAD